ncbi:substrate-binding domain-containing protein [Streptomyces sp. NPDC101151]|uniref:substrate-binding domain-containing protein n=1 Tax=Streptomyces sp. NPDC101151 TaxID=3366115 RepID=UPI003820FF42
MNNSTISGTAGVAAVIVGALVVAGAATGCSDKAPERSDAGPVATSSAPSQSARMKVQIIYQSDPSDPSLRLVLDGIRKAGDGTNIALTYAGASSTGRQADLIQKAIDNKIDGIALIRTDPHPLRALINKAQKAGIAVVGLEPGPWKSMKPLAYIGMDDISAGSSAGSKLDRLGSKHVLCVIHERGNTPSEDRCTGLRKKFKGRTDILYADVNEDLLPNVISVKLRQDPSIDVVLTAESSDALPATQAVSDANGHARVAAIGISKEVAAAIRSGKIDFAVDMNFTLQGYLAVRLLEQQENKKPDETIPDRALATPEVFDRGAIDKIDEMPLLQRKIPAHW